MAEELGMQKLALYLITCIAVCEEDKQAFSKFQKLYVQTQVCER